LGAAGLAAAAHFARGGLLALCLAVWGYFLVQSAYFLIGARTPGAGAALDPFDRARARLLRLLGDVYKTLQRPGAGAEEPEKGACAIAPRSCSLVDRTRDSTSALCTSCCSWTAGARAPGSVGLVL